MSPDVPPRTPLRSAAELNERIRALWTGPGGHPTLRLLAELRQVERGDVVEAA